MTRKCEDDSPRLSYYEKVREDKVFLLSLIDDPVKTFKAYGYDGDPILMGNMMRMAEDVRKRAIEVFKQAGINGVATNDCDACRGCNNCGNDALIANLKQRT